MKTKKMNNDQKKQERIAKAEVKIDYLEKSVSTIFKKIEQLPVKIGNIIEEKIGVLDTQAKRYQTSWLEWQRKHEKQEEKTCDRIEDLEKFKQKIEDYWKIIGIIVVGLGGVIGFALNFLHKIL